MKVDLERGWILYENEEPPINRVVQILEKDFSSYGVNITYAALVPYGDIEEKNMIKTHWVNQDGIENIIDESDILAWAYVPSFDGKQPFIFYEGDEGYRCLWIEEKL